MSWLKFKDDGESKSGKTKVWSVTNTRGQELGKIAWAGSFRKYAFAPLYQAVYDSGCLRELAEFCDQATVDHGQFRKLYDQLNEA